ncbi:unnamed protein product [Onchocerca flexuosa]|uniref:Uncharacterized protein n=1 Tax=Onchocerca flexuosa TaxID=387005 RepID=A0A183HWR5_9BILA|nr:unnamed protein product [Onchocerca flexuosa]
MPKLQMRMGNSENIGNNYRHMDDSSSMEQMNTSIRYLNSLVTLKKHLMLAEQSVNNQNIGNATSGDQTFGGANPVAHNINLIQRNLVDNSNIDKWLSERYMNMSI